MKICLKCEDNIRKLIEEILVFNNIEIDDESDIIFVEKELLQEVKSSIYIVFDKTDLSSFLNFIKKFQENTKQKEKFITARLEDKFEIFSYDKIQYFEADNNDIYCIVDNDKNIYKVKEKLYELESTLDNKKFIRVSKSNIVNIINIKEIIPWFGSKLLIKFKGTSKTIEVTRTYVKEFKNYIGI